MANDFYRMAPKQKDSLSLNLTSMIGFNGKTLQLTIESDFADSNRLCYIQLTEKEVKILRNRLNDWLKGYYNATD